MLLSCRLVLRLPQLRLLFPRIHALVSDVPCIICYLSRNSTSAALQLIQKIEINKLENIGLLGFVAIWKVLKQMHERKCASNRNKLEDLSAVARVWLGGNTGAQEGISLRRLRNLIGESVEMNKYFGGYECDLDEGYGTQ